MLVETSQVLKKKLFSPKKKISNARKKSLEAVPKIFQSGKGRNARKNLWSPQKKFLVLKKGILCIQKPFKTVERISQSEKNFLGQTKFQLLEKNLPNLYTNFLSPKKAEMQEKPY